MQGTGIWVLGGIIAILGIVGLLFASHAEEGPIYTIGLMVFAGAILADLWLVKQSFDRTA